jgi:hypothetical protein
VCPISDSHFLCYRAEQDQLDSKDKSTADNGENAESDEEEEENEEADGDEEEIDVDDTELPPELRMNEYDESEDDEGNMDEDMMDDDIAVCSFAASKSPTVLIVAHFVFFNDCCAGDGAGQCCLRQRRRVGC